LFPFDQSPRLAGTLEDDYVEETIIPCFHSIKVPD